MFPSQEEDRYNEDHKDQVNYCETKMRVAILLISLISSTAIAADYTSPYGDWRGQTQYQAFIRTASDAAAHAITDLTINIDPRGKVVGTSVENGCRMLGLAAPGATPTIVTLNVTLSGCTYAGYNRTYQGSLSVFTKDHYSKFSLQAIDVSSASGRT